MSGTRDMLDDDAPLPPPLKIGDRVRYCDATPKWFYGSIVAPFAGNLADLGNTLAGNPTAFAVKLDDDATVTVDADALWCLDWPRDSDKPWPIQDDCPACPGTAGPGGSHKFGCSLHGARGSQVRMSAVQDPDGKFKVNT